MQQPPEFQEYTEQIRRFYINDDGVNLSFTLEDPLPLIPDPNFHRRDEPDLGLERTMAGENRKSLRFGRDDKD